MFVSKRPLPFEVMPFEEDRLPVKYLGVPLVPSRLIYKDCKELIEKVEARVNDWKSKSLSIAGRLQLVQSVIASMHVYWASVFTLPMRILLDIELIMRGLLWNLGTLRKGSSKVAWEIMCLPKVKGGLGIRRLECFNKALMAVHIWKLLTMKDCLWVTWIHIHKFKETATFGILHCRGKHVWDEGNPLADFISTRDMFRAGLNTSSKVADIIVDGTLSWPQKLGSKYPNLLSIQSPKVSYGVHDKLEWRFRSGSIKPFMVNLVWHSIRPRGVKVVWCHMRDVAGMSHVPPSLELILDYIIPIAKRRTSRSVISKLVLASSTYFIWQERNEHLFKSHKRTAAQVIECIMSAVRLKLVSCRFKKSKAGLDLMKRWKIPEVLLI
ncbi:hypothetical protein Tco_0629841 [Tanacetum coccineum]|uniref:Reverse transcriptase zinc-binding domain-containing protein n=1 Tax=Tanacetum coccineum TaxID=301880 RepID=A0ABQ4WUA9_9ASTR